MKNLDQELEQVMKKYGKVEKKAPICWWVDFGTNAKNEKVLVVVSIIDYQDGAQLPKLWKKHGYIDHELQSVIDLSVNVTLPDGTTWGKYNPKIKENNKIDFDWMLEVTPENLDKLLQEVERRAHFTKGE